MFHRRHYQQSLGTTTSSRYRIYGNDDVPSSNETWLLDRMRNMQADDSNSTGRPQYSNPVAIMALKQVADAHVFTLSQMSLCKRIDHEMRRKIWMLESHKWVRDAESKLLARLNVSIMPHIVKVLELALTVRPFLTTHEHAELEKALDHLAMLAQLWDKNHGTPTRRNA